MYRARSASAPATLRLQQPASPEARPASIADVNQLGIRILGLKSIPVQQGARLKALLDCASELKRLPRQSVPLVVGDLVNACSTLPGEQGIDALRAVFAFQKPPAW